MKQRARYRRHELLRLLVTAALALAVGAATGRIWMALAIASMALVAWHYLRLGRMLRDQGTRRPLAPPQRAGAWDALERLHARRQSELRTRHRRLAGLLRTYQRAATLVPDGVLILGRGDDRIEWFNRAAGRMFGLRGAQHLDAPLREAVASPRLSAWLDTSPREVLLELPSPAEPGATLSLYPIAWDDERWLLVARDVSMLMHLQQVRRDFVANVSHELRTPLTVVHGYLDMIEPEEHPELASIIDEMRRQSRRMTNLVEDLLTLSRLEAQDAPVDEEPIHMPLLLRTLQREAEALSQGRHVVTVDDRAGCDLRGSTKELHSAFSNLIGNAVRHTPGGGRVEVRFEREDAGAVFSVTDTGYGIPAAHLSRITERFYRVSTSRSRDSGGTGLGLSIVKHVLGLHQARLEVRSDIGRGSVFSCHFGPERVIPRSAQPH